LFQRGSLARNRPTRAPVTLTSIAPNLVEGRELYSPIAIDPKPFSQATNAATVSQTTVDPKESRCRPRTNCQSRNVLHFLLNSCKSLVSYPGAWREDSMPKGSVGRRSFLRNAAAGAAGLVAVKPHIAMAQQAGLRSREFRRSGNHPGIHARPVGRAAIRFTRSGKLPTSNLSRRRNSSGFRSVKSGSCFRSSVIRMRCASTFAIDRAKTRHRPGQNCGAAGDGARAGPGIAAMSHGSAATGEATGLLPGSRCNCKPRPEKEESMRRLKFSIFQNVRITPRPSIACKRCWRKRERLRTWLKSR
jgi:hypothetical protein